MHLILLFKNEKINLSDLSAKNSDFEKMWVARLHTLKVEKQLLQSHFPMTKKEFETIAVYYQNETPQYIHRRFVHDATVEYLIVVEEWMLAVYSQKKEFDANFQIKRFARQNQQTLRAERNEKIAKRVAYMEHIANDWLKKSKQNFRNWREIFETQEAEADRLLQLLDKKMLS